ncbi:MAG: glycosidase [Pedobacter sp.]|uniref:glycoside hydrolase family 130 protein n=1 Tax=Pedobacter sp. TaxID=1411316 RepID=UPI003565521F
MKFKEKLNQLFKAYETLVSKVNEPSTIDNGVFKRYKYPVLTAAHIPVFWKYDLDQNNNPYLMERIGVNATFNAGAIKFKDKYLLIVRVEASDRKSFFAIAESDNGIDNFRFREYPINLPVNAGADTNVYDMRITLHEDGYYYGLFCTEQRDPEAHEYDQSAAIAQCGIVRTLDFEYWERLPDLKTPSAQQRNVVLHPEFYKGKYALYTRPQDSFIEAGHGGGIGFSLCESMENAIIGEEYILDKKAYHTVYELKNGQGPAPIKTIKGWLHLAHGVRNTAAGLRYVLYMFMTDLNDLTKIIHKPGGYFIAPEGEERIGDVSNVVFCNGWIVNGEEVFIYYASSDTRMHVATSTISQLLDYVMNTPEDGFSSGETLKTFYNQIEKNLLILDKVPTGD